MKFSENRMAVIADEVSQRIGCDRSTVLRCASVNALFYAVVQFKFGRGRYPVKCMEHLLKLL